MSIAEKTFILKSIHGAFRNFNLRGATVKEKRDPSRICIESSLNDLTIRYCRLRACFELVCESYSLACACTPSNSKLDSHLSSGTK